MANEDPKCKLDCICTICCCGNHKCPVQRTIIPWDPNTKSEYAATYTPKSCPSSHVKRAPTRALISGPFTGETTNRTDFVPLKLDEKRVSNKPKWCKPEGDIDASTTYQTDFTPKKVAVQHSSKRGETAMVSAPFIDQTTSRSDFRDHGPQARTHSMKPQRSLSDCSTPFDGQTLYEKEYRKHPICLPLVTKPQHNLVTRGEMEFKTNYRQNYVEFEPSRAKKIERPKVTCRPGEFDGVTIYRQEYQPRQCLKPICVKPRQSSLAQGGPFFSQTTNRADFVPLDVQPQIRGFRPVYQAPAGEMDLTTNYTAEYKPHQVARSYAPRNTRTVAQVEAPFFDDTTYRNDFPKHSAEVPRSCKPAAEVRCSQPFDDKTVYKENFDAKVCAPPPSCKPKVSAGTAGPFHGETTYRKDFQQIDGVCTRQNCPAGRLKKTGVNVDGFVYRGEACQHERFENAVVAQ